MNIFKKRPLGLILCIILGGFALFATVPLVLRTVLIILSFLSIALSFSLKHFRNNTLLKVSCVAVLISFILSYLYFEMFFYPNYDDLSSQTEIVAEVLDIEKNSEYQSTLDLKCKEIDGKKQNYKIKLYFYGEDNDISVGNIIKFQSLIKPFESSSGFDFKTFYTSRGVSGMASAVSAEVISEGEIPYSYQFSQIRLNIYERAKRFSNQDAASLFSALLLGESNMLSLQLELDFSRIGIAHILALSGIHLAILTALLEKIFLLLRFGKKTRTIIECIFCLLFMGLTGFPLSVCRAGIMLIISSILFTFVGVKDGIISLFLSFAIIVLFTPYAVLDMGLWLSVVATFGILLAGDIIRKRYEYNPSGKSIYSDILTSILFSLFAICATSAITSLNFSSTSIISIISTLIFSVLTEIYVYIGLLVLIFGKIIPIGNILIILENFISEAVAFISDIPFICASNSYLSVKIFHVILTMIFAAFAIVKVDNKKIITSLLAISYVFVSVFSVSLYEFKKNDDTIISEAADGDRIIFKSIGETAIFDNSLYRNGNAYDSLDFLYEEGLCDIDKYIFASYSSYLPASVNTLMGGILIGKIMLPMPENEDEENIAIEIFTASKDFRTEIEFYDNNRPISVGVCQILVPYRDMVYKSLCATFKIDGKIYSYISKGTLEYLPKARELLYVSDTVIFGSYGKAYSDAFWIDEYSERLKNIVIYDDKIYIDKNAESDYLPNVYFYEEKNIIFD